MVWSVKKLIGIVCLGAGFLALVTPLTPGAWLIFVGMELLGLTFLLPKGVRDRWEMWKAGVLQRFRRTFGY